jgi:Asp-tRNA(Asn)/Glu-tRNA(Gln) amidotransferase A subunit family amidase
VAYKLGRFGENQVDAYADDRFTVPASLAGLPAISVPAGVSPEGLPIGESCGYRLGHMMYCQKEVLHA